MDPNANLKRQQELLPQVRTNSYARYEIYDLRVDLRDWIAKGGALPDWDAYPEAAEAYKRWSR